MTIAMPTDRHSGRRTLCALGCALGCALTFGLTWAPTGMAAAPTIVDCTRDAGALTTAVSRSSSGDTLIVKGSCSGSVAVQHDLTLVGQGDASIAALVVGPGPVTAVLTHFTITNSAPNTTGVGIQNSGNLTLIDSLVTGNKLGIFNDDSATLTLIRSRVWNNSNVIGDVQSFMGPVFAVGGIYNSGVLSLIVSSVRGNSASIGGRFNQAVGGILSINAPIDVEPRGPISVTLIASDVTGNTATTTGIDDGAVGGIERAWPNSTMTLLGSKVANNSPGNCSGFTDPACN